MLVTAPLDKGETELPSPERLKRRIILKHKKLPDGVDETIHRVHDTTHDNVHGMDIANSVQSGILYLQVWPIHFSSFCVFKLLDNLLFRGL